MQKLLIAIILLQNLPTENYYYWFPPQQSNLKSVKFDPALFGFNANIIDHNYKPMKCSIWEFIRWNRFGGIDFGHLVGWGEAVTGGWKGGGVTLGG